MAEDEQPGSTSTTYAFAAIFLLASLSLCSVTFATNHWQDIFVLRDELADLGVEASNMRDEVFYDRFRGLFRTCFPQEASFLDDRPDAREGLCLIETGYEIPTRNPDTVAFGSNYELRIHLLRSQFAALVFAMVFLLVAAILSVLGCWTRSPRIMRSTGTLVFIGMFFTAGSIALFHGIYYLESNILTNVPGTLAYISTRAQTDIDYARLEDVTYSQFGYSYMLAWVSVGVAAIAGILFLVVGYKFNEKQSEVYGRKSRRRNRAYEYMEKPRGPLYGPAPYPYPPEPVVPVPVDPYGSYRY